MNDLSTRDIEVRLTRALHARAGQIQASDLAGNVTPLVAPDRLGRHRSVTTLQMLAAVAAVVVLAAGLTGVRLLRPPARPPAHSPVTSTPPTPTPTPTYPSRSDGPTRPSSHHGLTRGNLPAVLPQLDAETTAANHSHTFGDGTVARLLLSGGTARLQVTPPGEETQTSDPIPAVPAVSGSWYVENVALDLGSSTIAAYPRHTFAYVVGEGYPGGDRLTVLTSQAGFLETAAVDGAVPFGTLTEGGLDYVTYPAKDGHFYTLAQEHVAHPSQVDHRFTAWQWTIHASYSTGGVGPELSVESLGVICIDNPAGRFGRCP